ncbi:MAG: YbaK/EbsC family protein [Haloferacaceae archaeon]
MHPRAAEFRDCVRERHDLAVDVEEFPEGTKTAADAAAAVGCSVAQIASSLVFVVSGDPVVVVTSGANRVDESRIAAHLSAPAGAVSMADADRVREATGWSIGGVPPLCHDADPPVLVDETLLEHDVVYAAAGTPNAVFPVDPAVLVDLAGGTAVDVVGSG